MRSEQRSSYSSIVLQMTRRWLILADDLTGAADCAIALGRRGLAAVVIWGDMRNARSRQEPILAYDTASRGLSAAAAAARHRDVLASQPGSGRLFFKKIDSTLRGQPAAEIAATLECLGSRSGPAFGVLAAAFPGPVARQRAVASRSTVVRSRKQTSGDATILIPMQILLTFSRPRAFAARRSHLPQSVMVN